MQCHPWEILILVHLSIEQSKIIYRVLSHMKQNVGCNVVHWKLEYFGIYIIKTGVCRSVCLSTFKCPNPNQSSSVEAVGQPMVYIRLSYDLAEVIKLIGQIFEPKGYSIFFQKSTLCHSFCITVIPLGLLSFLPHYCRSI